MTYHTHPTGSTSCRRRRTRARGARCRRRCSAARRARSPPPSLLRRVEERIAAAGGGALEPATARRHGRRRTRGAEVGGGGRRGHGRGEQGRHPRRTVWPCGRHHDRSGTRSAAPSPSTPPFSRTAGVKCREKLFEDYATARGDLQGSKWFGVKGKDGSFT